MIKSILASLWIAAVALGSSYAALSWRLSSGLGNEKGLAGLDYIKPKTINAPVVADGAVQGYIIAQFVFTVDRKLAREMSVPPETFLLDEAFKAIYGGANLDFHKITREDLATLAKTVTDRINERFGARFVHEALIQKLTYLPKEKTRAGGRL